MTYGEVIAQVEEAPGPVVKAKEPTRPLAPAAAKSHKAPRWRRWLALAVALGVTALVIAFRSELRQFSRYGYLGVFLLSLASNATIILPVPGLVSVFAAGSAFNPLLVGLVAGVAEPIGEMTGYLAGYAGRAVIEDQAMYNRIMGWMRRHNYRTGYAVVFVLSLIPNPLFDMAGIAAGALKLPVGGFLLSCWLGKTIKAIAVAFAGAGSVRFLESLFS